MKKLITITPRSHLGRFVDERKITVFGRTYHWPLPLVTSPFSGAGAALFGYALYMYPFPWWVDLRVVPIISAIYRIINGLFYRFVDRRHVLSLNISPGYHSWDEVTFHAIFRSLTRYIEAEIARMEVYHDEKVCYYGFCIEQGDQYTAIAHRQMIDLYLWYHGGGFAETDVSIRIGKMMSVVTLSRYMHQ